MTIRKWDVKGYELHGCVTMMLNLAVGDTVKQTKFMRGCFGYNLKDVKACYTQSGQGFLQTIMKVSSKPLVKNELTIHIH